MWSNILRLMPNSKLLLKAKSLFDEGTRQYIRNSFKEHEIEGNRLSLQPQTVSYKEHLETYNRIDIALDTYPYHGTTTTCEALWMGVPVITLAGNTHASRVGVSILTNLGLPELIAHSSDEYVRIATQLAGDMKKLQVLRKDLRNIMARSVLTDAKRFTKNLEKCYRDIWVKWCNSQ